MELETQFAKESLSDKKLLESTYSSREIQLIPDVNVLKIGGQSIMDRGKPAVFQIVEEIAKNKNKHKMILGVGGGTRSRHTYSIALDLGMPTGIIAVMGASISRQNARMLYMLLAKHGGIFLPKDHFEEIPLYLNSGCIPITCGMPPYEFWEHPPKKGRIPAHRTDVGVYLIAEVLGAKSMIFVKDEDGLYTADRKKDPKAEFIPKISVAELMKLDLPDLIIERAVLDLMLTSRHIKKIQIINGLKPENISKALEGEEIGTTIYI